jgi:hypothetical protein
MNKTRRANAKSRHQRTHLVEEILKVCSETPESETANAAILQPAKDISSGGVSTPK